MESLMELMGGVKTKIIEIGAWDMDASATPGTILHGIASIDDIGGLLENWNYSDYDNSQEFQELKSLEDY